MTGLNSQRDACKSHVSLSTRNGAVVLGQNSGKTRFGTVKLFSGSVTEQGQHNFL